MALIKCPECGQMVSGRAAACIKCGFPIQETAAPVGQGSNEAAPEPASRKLAKEETMEYLRHAIRLEGNALGEQTVISDYIAVSEENKPRLQEDPEPSFPVFNKVPRMDYFDIILVSVGIVFLILSIYNLIRNRFSHLGIDMGVALAIVAFVIVYFVLKMLRIRALIGQNQIKREEYNARCWEYEEMKRQHEEEYESNLAAWKENSESNIQFLRDKRDETLRALNEFYQPSLVYPKYRTLPALTTIYEYLSSGRCDELAGPNGAYNLYESELRQDMVIEKMNLIVENLEQIRKNQQVLYGELTKINATTRQVATEMRMIRGYTAALTSLATLNTYYNAIAADNTAALAFLHVIK